MFLYSLFFMAMALACLVLGCLVAVPDVIHFFYLASDNAQLSNDAVLQTIMRMMFKMAIPMMVGALFVMASGVAHVVWLFMLITRPRG